jgi:hypothetical protein
LLSGANASLRCFAESNGHLLAQAPVNVHLPVGGRGQPARGDDHENAPSLGVARTLRNAGLALPNNGTSVLSRRFLWVARDLRCPRMRTRPARNFLLRCRRAAVARPSRTPPACCHVNACYTASPRLSFPRYLFRCNCNVQCSSVVSHVAQWQHLVAEHQAEYLRAIGSVAVLVLHVCLGEPRAHSHS